MTHTQGPWHVDEHVDETDNRDEAQRILSDF